MPEIKIQDLQVNSQFLEAWLEPIQRYEAVAYLIRHHLHFNEGAEIGVRNGETARYLLDVFPDLLLYVIDPYTAYLDISGTEGKYTFITKKQQQEHYNNMLTNLEPVWDRVIMYRTYSNEAADRVQDRTLDFVFIDGNHAFEHVLEDIMIWMPKIRPGGILTGHDLGNHGVQKALKYMFVGTTKVIEHISNGDEVWGIKV